MFEWMKKIAEVVDEPVVENSRWGSPTTPVVTDDVQDAVEEEIDLPELNDEWVWRLESLSREEKNYINSPTSGRYQNGVQRSIYGDHTAYNRTRSPGECVEAKRALPSGEGEQILGIRKVYRGKEISDTYLFYIYLPLDVTASDINFHARTVHNAWEKHVAENNRRLEEARIENEKRNAAQERAKALQERINGS